MFAVGFTDQGSAATAAPIISTTKKEMHCIGASLFFVAEHWDEQKILTKFFVRGLLRSNDPKVAVMPATAVVEQIISWFSHARSFAALFVFRRQYRQKYSFTFSRKHITIQKLAVGKLRTKSYKRTRKGQSKDFVKTVACKISIIGKLNRT